MTAVPDWEVVGPSETDADLVRASLAGDRTAFGQMYDRYANRLHDFCIGMLHDRDGAADCVQDCFCVAATRLPQLRDPEKLRPWLYSIARNEALRRIRDRRRETPSEELPDAAADAPGPDTLAARTELADLIADAAGGLSDRDRSALELAFRHGLNGPDLADALGVTTTHANTIVHRLRDTIERSLGALLVARHVKSSGSCPELATMLEDWDGHFNVLMRKRISRHIESCDICDADRRERVNPAALLGAAPVFIPAPAWLRERTMSEIELVCHTSVMDDEAGVAGASAIGAGVSQADDAGGDRRNRKWVWLAVLLIAVLGASLGLTFAWLNRDPISIVPADVTETVPQPTGAATVPGIAPPTEAPVHVQTTDPVVTVQPPPQIRIPAVPPIDHSPPVDDSEPTLEFIPPDLPPSIEEDPRLDPQTGPTRTVTTRTPASPPPQRRTINPPGQPGDGRGGADDPGGPDPNPPRRGSTRP